MGVGEYPSGFNAKVHGPYSPARFYGKPDTPLGEVKVGELSNWLARRSYHPVNMAQAASRGFWRWSLTWMQCKKPGVAGLAQFTMGMSLMFYVFNYPTLKYHHHAKYRW